MLYKTDLLLEADSFLGIDNTIMLKWGFYTYREIRTHLGGGPKEVHHLYDKVRSYSAVIIHLIVLTIGTYCFI